MMDIDLDFSLAPSEIIYGRRAIMLDPVTQGACYLGSLNAMCIGVSSDGTQIAPGSIGNNATPYAIAIPPGNASYPFAPGGTGPEVPVYGPGRNCLWDVDPAYNGQIKPNDLCVSSNSGYLTKATPTGAYNQWVLGIARSYASKNQSCNVKVVIFPWMPTGS